MYISNVYIFLTHLNELSILSLLLNSVIFLQFWDFRYSLVKNHLHICDASQRQKLQLSS